MINLLLKLFVHNNEQLSDGEKRIKYSVFAGALGIVCNFVLFALKFTVGSIMSSIAIVSDAFNNLSDMGSSVVAIIGAKLSGKKPDKEHPFGHGRVEYISSLIVSFIIILVGFELLKSSVSKIFSPITVSLSPVLLSILCLSLPVKFWMYSYNKYLGRKIGSGTLLAASRDSINDVIATGAVILSAVVGKFVNFPPLDGIVGAIVSIIIMYSGFRISVDTIGLLLGTAPDKKLIEGIRSRVLDAPGVSGVHDLIVHDYGPGRILASVHAEVPDDCDVVEIHEVIDDLEKRIENELGVHIVVHMDPISVRCEQTAEIRELVRSVVKEIDSGMDIHDFRMTDGTNNLNLIFDVEVSPEFSDIDGLKGKITQKLTEKDERFNAVINVDFIYE
ncbi:MAG: cation transporter [Ruminococcaceae bacterium]|nr:cation transporter [Oscillospiraceae bacterium]